jgi:hypothetical protein
MLFCRYLRSQITDFKAAACPHLESSEEEAEGRFVCGARASENDVLKLLAGEDALLLKYNRFLLIAQDQNCKRIPFNPSQKSRAQAAL